MLTTIADSVTAPTQFLKAGEESYAYRRFGSGTGLPLLCLQHFTGTLDNWDPKVIDALAAGREVILFENAGVGRSTGQVPTTIAGMAGHAASFVAKLGLDKVDVLGFSLGGMVAQQMALDNPSLFRRMILVGTAPRGGEDIMRLDKPSLAQHFGNPDLKGYEILQKIFFTPSDESQAAGAAFIARLMERQSDREPASGGDVIQAQMAAFGEWSMPEAERFLQLQDITQPTLVVNGLEDEMIPVRNSYWLAENLPNALLLAYPDAGHGSLFQFHDEFVRTAKAFLTSDSPSAVF